MEKILFRGFGVNGSKVKSKNKKTVKNFTNSLKLFGYGYSWGGFESLALYQSQDNLEQEITLILKKTNIL